MNYNDFQLPNDKTFELINNHLRELNNYSKKENINSICLELNKCANMCSTISNNHNSKLKQSLKNVKDVLLKLYDNFSSTFNIKLSNHTINSFSIFSFLKMLLNIISLTSSWEQHESNEYYRSMAQKNNMELIGCCNLILSSLEESNIHFFKHM